MSEPVLSIARFNGVLEVARPDGARLPIYAIGIRPHAPGLLVGRANGFSAELYEPWLYELAQRFCVIAWDARGHGGSSWPEGPLEDVFSVDRLADDLAAGTAAAQMSLHGAPLHFAGHSPAGVESAVFAAHRDADTWQRLPQVRHRLHLVGGDPAAEDRSWVSVSLASVSRQLPAADLVVVPNTGHLMVFQRPDACRGVIFQRLTD